MKPTPNLKLLALAAILSLSSCCSSDRPAGYPSHYPLLKRMWYLPC